MERKLTVFGVGVEIAEVIRPIPVGDGIHDDTDVLQWYATRRFPFPQHGTHGNTFLITRTIQIPSSKSLRCITIRWRAAATTA